MSWIRLSDDYIDHPKFVALSASAFRLWHEGMAYCRKHRTDGVLLRPIVFTFRYYKAPRVAELTTPYEAGKHPLWHVTSTGFLVHDFFDWNDSRAEEEAEKGRNRDRQRRRRHGVTGGGTHALIQERTGDQSSSESKEDADGRRAGALLSHYPLWYSESRHGAKTRIIHNSLEFSEALSLVAQWDDERLEKLAKIVLTTDETWIAGTDRSFRIFALKASWADDRLKQWEIANSVSV